MSSFGENSHVFVIRAWLEPREIPGRSPEWRFSVEHIESGDRRYVLNVSSVVGFMERHLSGARWADSWWQRLKRRFAQRMRRGDSG